MKHNTLISVAGSFGYPDTAERMKSLFLYDYYINKYHALIGQRFPEADALVSAEKMLLNFFLVCINSTTETSHGLFQMFQSFKINSAAMRIDFDGRIERIMPMMPNYRLKDDQWVARLTTPAFVADLPDKSYNLIKDCDELQEYAEMIDKGFDEVINKLPEYCLLEAPEHGTPENKWNIWKKRLSNLYIVAGEAKVTSKPRNVVESYSPSFLINDKKSLSDIVRFE